MTKTVGAIVLAAGFSSRFGSSKLLAELSSGKTVFQQTVERVAEAFPERFVITRPKMVAALQELAEGTSILSFEHADQGMGATLAFAAQQIGDWDGCVVCLGDMPFIETATYRRIAELVTTGSIVTPTFDSKMGNPVAFGKNLYTDLEALTGDSGGKKLTSMYPQSVRELQVSDPGILHDIDTPEELAFYKDS
ncbi:nucleotidyltransferase family protein [Gammaproteobacteria bacterium]|nr:nucleotidyltransferase family protein [Gammaproteobacteria bacterium]